MEEKKVQQANSRVLCYSILLQIHTCTPSFFPLLPSFFPSCLSILSFLPSFLPFPPFYTIPPFVSSFLPSFIPSFLPSFLNFSPRKWKRTNLTLIFTLTQLLNQTRLLNQTFPFFLSSSIKKTCSFFPQIIFFFSNLT